MTNTDPNENADGDRPSERLQTLYDGLFKLILNDTTRSSEVLKAFQPIAIAERLLTEPPKLIEGSVIDLALCASQSDRLFKVKPNRKAGFDLCPT